MIPLEAALDLANNPQKYLQKQSKQSEQFLKDIADLQSRNKWLDSCFTVDLLNRLTMLRETLIERAECNGEVMNTIETATLRKVINLIKGGDYSL